MKRPRPHIGVHDFVHGLRFDELPCEVVEQARRCLSDLVGVAASGSATRLSRIMRDHVARNFRGAVEDPRLLFDGRDVSPVGAALAGAATIDAMDGHDGHRLTKGHAGVAVLPSVLAFVRSESDTRELLTALVVGYEIATRAGVALHATAGDYHSSGAWNALGAAAVGARLLRLDRPATAHAFGIAEYHAPRALMMRCIDHPTMVKDSSACGAQAGVSAALLAADGFTGAPADLLGGPATRADRPWGDLGERWTILEQYVKPYPVCRWAHPAVQAVVDLVSGGDIAAQDIRSINVTTFHAATRLATKHPETTEQAQYSLPFSVAAAAVHHRLTPEIVADPQRADEQVGRLAVGIGVHESAEMTAAFPAGRTADVTLTLTDGRRLSSGPTTAAGDPEAPLTRQEMAAKFLAAATPVVGDVRARRLAQLLDRIEDHALKDVLDELCAPGCAARGA